VSGGDVPASGRFGFVVVSGMDPEQL